MQIVFRANLANEEASGAGEIFLRPLGPDATRRDLAAFVVANGLPKLVQGQPPIKRIVIPCDTTRPTLDDMLASLFVQRLIEGSGLPPAATAFAKYAALAREGLQPGDTPLESSLEGVFLAIRTTAGADLSKPDIAAKFLSHWERMTQVIVPAMEAGKDPFTTNLFTESRLFAREHAYLKKDQDVYLEDVRRGQKWLVQLPGGPPTSAMLLLDQPKSLLWKYWSRRDTTAPGGGSYLLLVVNWGNGNWVISTDPVQRLEIKGLAVKLQEAESSINKDAAAKDPWFEGAPFGYTLVAAPRAGTKLQGSQILAIVRKWSKARPVEDVTRRVAKRTVALAGGSALTILVTVVSSFMIARMNAPKPIASQQQQKDDPVDFRTRGSVLSTTQIKDLKSTGIHLPGYAVIVGVGDKQGDFPALPASCRNARLFYNVLRDVYGFDPKNMRLLTDRPKDPTDPDDPDIPADGPPTKAELYQVINDLGTQTSRYQDGSRTNFVFFYGGHGDPRQLGQNKIGYLVLSGYKPTDADNTGFDMSYLVNFVSHRISSSHQMLLVDCCYSGFVINARGLRQSDASAIYEMWKEKARAVITAGTADQQSLEVGPKALFTSNLVRALTPTDTGHIPADKNNDGIVTDEELYDYLNRAVSSDAHALGRDLTPQYLRALPDSDDDVGQFLFIPKSDAK